VGSNPPLSIIITQGNYGIKSRLISVIVGQTGGYKIQTSISSIQKSPDGYQRLEEEITLMKMK
jgi:hypothetical protein